MLFVQSAQSFLSKPFPGPALQEDKESRPFPSSQFSRQTLTHLSRNLVYFDIPELSFLLLLKGPYEMVVNWVAFLYPYWSCGHYSCTAVTGTPS